MEDFSLNLEKSQRLLEVSEVNKMKETINKISKKRKLIAYIKAEVKKGRYHSLRFLQNKFRTRIYDEFESVYDLYRKAGIEYKQKNSQELKNKKATIFTKIVLDVLHKIDLEVLDANDVHNRGVDIITTDSEDRLVGIELKAFNKYEPIKKRNLEQAKNFLREGFYKIILITTTSRVEPCVLRDDEIIIITYEKLKALLNKSQLKAVQYIRNASVHEITDEKTKKKQLIVKYVKGKIKQGTDFTIKDIDRDLHLDIRSYFSSLTDIYKEGNITPSLQKIGGRRNSNLDEQLYQEVINRILIYMKNEIHKGHYPSGLDVGKEFGVSHIWNFITMAELYKRLGTAPYYQRKLRPRLLKKHKGLNQVSLEYI